MLATVLRQAGYTVEVATNGTETLAMVEMRPPNLLLDLQLPGCDGRDILTALRAREATQGLPVVVFTGVEGITEGEIRNQRVTGDPTSITSPSVERRSATTLLPQQDNIHRIGRNTIQSDPH